nr:hypothetical protein [Geodermatophilus chilensis]
MQADGVELGEQVAHVRGGDRRTRDRPGGLGDAAGPRERRRQWGAGGEEPVGGERAEGHLDLEVPATGSGTSHGRSTRSARIPDRSMPIGRSSPPFFARQASWSIAAWQAAASSSGMPATSSLTPSPTERRVTLTARWAFSRRRSDAAASRAVSSRRSRSFSLRIDIPAASGSTAASTSAMSAGSVSRAGQPSSSANVRARGQSSSPAASTARVAVIVWVSVSACSVSVVADARAQFNVNASSSAKNSDTPSGAVSSPTAAPGSPGWRSCEAGRSAANPATSSSL